MTSLAVDFEIDKGKLQHTLMAIHNYSTFGWIFMN